MDSIVLNTQNAVASRSERTHLIRTLLVLTTASLLAAPLAEAKDAEMPANVVAIVSGKNMSMQGFRRSLVKHVQRDLKETQSGPRAVLEQMVEELSVRQWCIANNVTISQAEVDKRLREFDRQIRRHSGGQRTLRDEIKSQGTTEREFRMQLEHELAKQAFANNKLAGTMPTDEHARIHQTKVVIAELRKSTNVEYGMPMKKVVAVKLPRGVIARVNGEPITVDQFGKQLAIRLPSNDVREALDRECKTGLMLSQSVRLSNEELDDEIKRLRDLWPIERELQREEVWRTVTFKERFEAKFKMSPKEVRESNFHRGLFGLIRKMRKEVTDEAVRAEFKERQDALYGSHVLATDFRIAFAQRKQVFGGPRRARNAAQREARMVLSWLGNGMPLSEAKRRVGAKKDPSFTAMDVRFYNTENDRLLYEAAMKLRKDEPSAPIETLSEVHVLVRKGTRAARTLKEVAPLIREFLARRGAREWLETRIKDPKFVRVRWPLPDRK